MGYRRTFVYACAVNISSYGATHIGMVRELNEDAVMCRNDIGLWAIADGMGGHEAGDTASSMIVDCLEGLEAADAFANSLSRAQALIHKANVSLIEDFHGLERHRKPGSTVVMLLIQGDQAAAVWAGDSRLYRLRGNMLEQITRDHSHVQDLIESGLLDSSQAESHPLANVITRAVGIDATLELATLEFGVQAGDRYLLCSDGLSRTVSDAEIAAAMAQPDSRNVVEQLMPLALERGAPDNVSIISINCGPA